MEVAEIILDASGMITDNAVEWFFTVSLENVPFDSLLLPNYPSSKFPSKSFIFLDRRLAKALMKLSSTTGAFSTKVSQAQEAQLSECQKLLSGRQILWLIYDYLKTNDDMQLSYGLRDLQEIVWLGDAHLTTFYNLWIDTAEKLREELSDQTMRELLLEQMKQSPMFKTDLDHFRREKGKPDHSYKFLLKCMSERMTELRQETNRDKRLADLKQKVKQAEGQNAALQLAAANAKSGKSKASPAEAADEEGWTEKKSKKNKKKKAKEEVYDEEVAAATTGGKGNGKGKADGKPKAKAKSSSAGDGAARSSGGPTEYLKISPDAGKRDICPKLLQFKSCNEFADGGCKDHWHPPMTKRGICTHFQRKKDGCAKGAACEFDHIAVGEKNTLTIIQNIQNKKKDGGARSRSNSPAAVKQDKPCKWEAAEKGSCRRGATCNFVHS